CRPQAARRAGRRACLLLPAGHGGDPPRARPLPARRLAGNLGEDRGNSLAMATLLVVGAGRHQRRAILRARELGHRVVVIDRNAGAPGLEAADVAEIVDFSELERVVEVGRRQAIDGVMTVAADRAVPVVEAILEEFVEGTEMNGIVVVRAGTATLLTLSDRLRPPGIGFGVGWIHVYPPSIDSDQLGRARAIAAEAVLALGMRDGIAFPQLIATRD